jgi:hypothetical protein
MTCLCRDCRRQRLSFEPVTDFSLPPLRNSASLPGRPLRVNKLLRVHWDGSKTWFTGDSCSVRYTADDVAGCYPDQMYPGRVSPRPAVEGDHLVPHRDCSCGFHAQTQNQTQNQTQYQVISGSWGATVELFGHIVEHEVGWRASRQRVLSVMFPKRCFACGRGSCPLGLYSSSVSSEVNAFCGHHGNPFPYQGTALSLTQLRGALSPVEIDTREGV